MTEKEVHTPDYDGLERRHSNGRRPEDVIAGHLKLVSAILGIVLLILTMGIAWGTSKAALDDKVNRKEFMERNVLQDDVASVTRGRQDRLESLLAEQLWPTLKRLDERVSSIYCADKPPGCK